MGGYRLPPACAPCGGRCTSLDQAWVRTRRSFFTRIAALFGERVVLRSLTAGVVLGLLAMAIPLTMFYGATALPEATSQAANIGVAVLIVTAVAKIVAMTGARVVGFIGGPIFPLVFTGGILGAMVSVIFPEIPTALSVTAAMAAVPAAILPLPLAPVLAVVLAGTSMETIVPVLTAAALLARGLQHPRSEAQQSAQPGSQGSPPA